ncbi:DUF3078 domain-containing protein [Mesohalobacter halotolerans]|uniref:DUF3078 domain-containing protein n=1 Tax=Mesohalobacter halotolerans TaxID=1883405 RepID=A0A4U5TVA5_9FLAO|nr:DUF3078 domain-containing protein [Mesohalobacter halotolerans]TKS57514.1 DUF3078 domain-containing protein [Mesohalobacter halotolerans]
MKIKITLSILLSLVLNISFGQTKEELEEQLKEKQAQADQYQAEADEIKAQIKALPGWRFGAFGTIGGSISQFNNWYAQGTPNNDAGNIGITFNAFANKIEDDYFWKNALNINLSWIKFDDRDDPSDDSDFRAATDVFNISSLYGYRLSETWAVSAFTEYRTTIIDNINDPGYLDIGTGMTWTPNSDLTVVIHPLNYNFVFSSGETEFESSLGAKIVGDYTKSFGKLNVKSNLSLFQSYEESNLSNWTWTNSLGYTIWKGIGVGFDFALRDNKQEAVNFALDDWDSTGSEPNFDNIDNDLQSFWTFGLSYKF